MKMKLCEAMERKSTNIDGMRFVASLGVLVAHAHTLSNNSLDWLSSSLGMTWGSLSVAFFFFVSGLYISRSLDRNPKSLSFIKNRILRIVPLLAIVVVASVLILGIFFSTYGMEYFGKADTWKYLLNICLIPVHNLPGVFEQNVTLTTVNGSLWTLPVEFLCYIGLLILYKLFKKPTVRGILLVLCTVIGTLFAVVLSYKSGNEFIMSVWQPVGLFLMGAICYLLREKLVMRWEYGVIGVILWILIAKLGAPFCANILCLPILIMAFLITSKQINWKPVAMLGELSYPVYLVSFPIQQAVISLNGGVMNPYGNMVCSIPVVLVAAAVLTYIERNCYVIKGGNSKK